MYFRNVEQLILDDLIFRNNSGKIPGVSVSYPGYTFIPLNVTNQKVEIKNI